MSYVDQNLMSGERVIYRAKLHWMVFASTIVWLALGALFLSGKASGGGVICILIGLVLGVFAYLDFSSSEFAVTDKRVIAKVGVIRRNSLETLLNKIEGVSVDQGIGGRIFGYGTITINGTGSTKSPFKKIDRPLEFRRAVQEQIEASTPKATAALGPAGR